MASAQIIWSSTPNSDKEIYYGIEGVATNQPDTGIGWTSFYANPVSSVLPGVSITDLDDNTKYKFLVRSVCDGSKGLFTETTSIKFICPTINVADITAGNLPYTIIVPSSLLISSSSVKKIRLKLTGVNQSNQATIVYDKVMSAPFIASYTNQFSHVEDGVDWKLQVIYENQSGFPLYECSSTQFSTVTDSNVKSITFRNGIAGNDITEIFLDGEQVLAEQQKSGTSSNVDINYLGSHPQGQHISVTIPSVLNGTQLIYKQIRAGAFIYGGSFTYSGPGSLLGSSLIQLQNNDVLQIQSNNTTGILPKQDIITKVSSPNGYNLKLKIDLPQSVSQIYTVSFVEFDYGTGQSHTFTSTLTIPSGQTISDTVTVSSSLPNLVFNRATYKITSITCNRSAIEISF